MSRLPTIFISHGSPMEALDAGRAWTELAAALPRPRAIVMVSAHFSAPYPVLGTTAQHDTIHDFYGFPQALYALRYNAPGEPDLAFQLAEALQAHGLPVRIDPNRGLDHGAWVPLRYMYPDADVPVVNLSIDENKGPAYHYQLGQALASSLADDVLLIASGSLTHNLGDFRRPHRSVPRYVTDFQAWMQDRLKARDIAALLDYREQSLEGAQAHPSDEHLLPLFVALGAAGEQSEAHVWFSEINHQILAMDVYRFERSA